MDKMTEAPRHWMGMEELNPEYWNNAEEQTLRGQEFRFKPIEQLAALESSPEFGSTRRGFLKLMGASMAMASAACVRRPVQKIIPYVVRPEEITPGVAYFYATTCPETGMGLLTKNREGRPIKLEGNPDHPVSKGSLSARAQASILDLYDPDRLKGPVAVTRDSGAAKSVTWEEVDAALAGKLAAASRVRVLSRPMISDSTRKLVSEFLGAFKDGAWVEYQAIGNDDVAQGQAESYGAAVIPHYRFDQANFIVSLGADFLGTWVSPVEFAGQWAKNRKLDSKKHATAQLSDLVVFESGFTVTGASADHRFGVRSGDELKIALALAHEIIVKRGVSKFAGNAAVKTALEGYSVEKVAADVGTVSAEQLKHFAEELMHHKGKSLVVAGGVTSRTAHALGLQVAVNLLNSALENDGVTVDGNGKASAHHASFAALASLVDDMKAGKVDVLVIHGVNPAYSLPAELEWDAAIAKVGTVISANDRVDETGKGADFVLPDHHYLENWGDAHLRPGLYSLGQPAVAPLYQTRAFQDTLLAWVKGGVKAGGMAGRVAGLAVSTANSPWHQYLMDYWKEVVWKAAGSRGTFISFWEGALQKGSVEVTEGRSASAREFKVTALKAIPAFAAGNDAVVFALDEKVSMGDGSHANNAWLQEMPDPVTTATWDNYLMVGPALAAQLKVETNDVVRVTFEGGHKFDLPALVQPGVHPKSVVAAVGYGRTAAGQVGNGNGVNVFPFAKVVGAGATRSVATAGIAVQLKKTGRRFELAITQGHHRTEGRPVLNDITLGEFKKNPKAAAHVDPHLRLDPLPTIWKTHEYKGHRWGMAIDLNSCTGCGACVVACQAENNIPVVGREQVRRGREMHWMRIDRYFSGSAEQPDTVFQPMLCQHCENAPCETVCPVLATVHDDEGTNNMAYNRCVGTRYCQNNCPYKVRRFNFFDHWKSYQEPMKLSYNPDVTVRSRGVMEKCSFCMQRINGAKNAAKMKGEKLKDGAFQVACQQTCPTNAIAFGDLNDPQSEVARLKNDDRGFRSLEVLNVKPAVTYLSKVRNKEAGGHDNGHHA